MTEIRNWVEAILYGGGSHRRFTQDGPVLPDVWTMYLEEAFKKLPDHRVPVLIEPHFDSSPALAAEGMQHRLGPRFDHTQTVYNRTIVSSWLSLDDLVFGVVPLTRWYADIVASRDVAVDRKSPFNGTLPSIAQTWDDCLRMDRKGYPFPKLLAFIRIVGIVADIRQRVKTEDPAKI